tara:strand:+ start:500 stop:919 length:420 start_codon:yes stop_codon:yes gene_type:complete
MGLPKELVTSKKIRALLFVRDPVETARLVQRARNVAEQALARMETVLAEEPELEIQDLLQMASVGARVTKDFVQVANILRSGIDEDQVLKTMMEQMHELEQAHEQLIEDQNEGSVDAEWTTSDSTDQPSVEEDQRSGSD